MDLYVEVVTKVTTSFFVLLVCQFLLHTILLLFPILAWWHTETLGE